MGGVSWAVLGTPAALAQPQAGQAPNEAFASSDSDEPSYELALAQWPDQLRPMAFLGCKDHLDEFGVMWNGNLTLHTVQWIDADVQLAKERPDPSLQVSFAVGDKPDFGERDRDDATTVPSLAEGYLPLTQVRIQRSDVTLLQEAFVCSADSTCHVAAWDSPVFLRVRFTVEDAGTGATPIHLWAQLAGNHISYQMETRRNVRILPIAPVYHDKLQASGNSVQDSSGRVIMAGNQVLRFYDRLPDSISSVGLRYAQLDRNLAMLALPRERGAAVELIFPYLPGESAVVLRVRNVEHAHAGSLVIESWKNEIGRGMQVHVPEEPLNQLWRFTPALTFMTADLYPTGDHVLKTSSHHYEAVWCTSVGWNIVDLIQRGYFEEAVNYLEPMLDSRLRRPVANDGINFDSSDGFISGAAKYILISWISDSGSILWAASEYYRVSRDRKFLDRWLPTMLQSVEWIARERALTKLRDGSEWRYEAGGPGLLPASRATDDERQRQIYTWGDAWNYRGLAALCKVLNVIGHKDAARWERERDDYRSCFQKIFRNQLKRTYQWTDRSGERIPFVPMEVGQIYPGDLTPVYSDGGPTYLGVSGLIDPEDESMTWVMKFLTEGPDAGTEFPAWSDFMQPPCLRYEISSGEPGLSWNIYLRFMRNERLKFLEGFYSLSAGAVSRKFLGGIETRDGIQACPAINSIIDSHLRNMLLFENDEKRGIELLRNSPSTWLRPGQEIRVQKAPTYFGLIGYTVRAVNADQVEAQIEGPDRESLAWLRLYLYHPEKKPLRSAKINGVSVRPLSSEVIEIRNPSRAVKVEAYF